MNYKKHSRRGRGILALFLTLAMLGASLAGCTEQSGQESTSSESAEEEFSTAEENMVENSEEQAALKTAVGEYDSWDEAAATKVTLNGDSIAVDGAGATVEGSVLTITQAGVYVISGSLTDGQIVVQAAKEDTVQLVLDGVDVACSDSAAIYSAKAGLTVITLPAGSRNTLSDGAEYAYPDADTDEPDAALFVKDNLRITGSGYLTVTGNYNNGIGSKDDLVIENGTIVVTAANHGVRGRDSLTVLGGTFDITAGNDGLQSNNDSEGKGWILLEDGTYTINSAHDAVQAETTLTVNGGTYSLVSGGGSAVVPEDRDGSYKGLKAGSDLVISGGTFHIDGADDAVHANGNVTVNGGVFEIATGDDGFHADYNLTINDGVINISTSYEGLEGATIDINGGEICLFATDDGVNAAGDDGEEGHFGRDRFAANENNHLTIAGGYLVVDAQGDGLDSNGNITMTGGTVIVNGPVRGGDAPLDFDGQFDITGGVLVAAGSSGMAQAPGSTSTQPTLQVYYSATQAAGTTLHLAAEDGAPLVTFTPNKDYQNIVISTPELGQGATYQLYTGGSATGEERDGLILGGSYSAGTLVVSAKLEEITTRISDSGEAVQGFGGFGGGMGPGGGMGGGRGAPPGAEEFTPPEGGGPGDMPGGGQRGGRPGGERPGQPES